MRAQNILVFRIGQLGDTIVALLAMWAVKNHFRNARLVECVERRNECLNRLQPGDVLEACKNLLNVKMGKNNISGMVRGLNY
jgi:hypothetical protein